MENLEDYLPRLKPLFAAAGARRRRLFLAELTSYAKAHAVGPREERLPSDVPVTSVRLGPFTIRENVLRRALQLGAVRYGYAYEVRRPGWLLGTRVETPDQLHFFNEAGDEVAHCFPGLSRDRLTVWAPNYREWHPDVRLRYTFRDLPAELPEPTTASTRVDGAYEDTP